MMNSAENRRTDTASRVVRASQQRLYRALLDPDAVAKWLPPAGMEGRIDIFEPVGGGRFRMTLTYRDAAHRVEGKSSEHSDIVEGRFTELVPHRRITQSFEFQSDRPELAGPMLMTWSFTAVADGTDVTIVCDNAPEAIRQEDHLEGFRSTLQNLALLIRSDFKRNVGHRDADAAFRYPGCVSWSATRGGESA